MLYSGQRRVRRSQTRDSAKEEIEEIEREAGVAGRSKLK